MAMELAFALITPYALIKSRTGGIIGRLIARTGLDLVGARMIGPSAKLVTDYADLLRRHGDTAGTDINEGDLLSAYVEKRMMPEAGTGKRQRVLLLVFEGDDAIARINRTIGRFAWTSHSAESIRDTFGDLVRNDKGEVVFIEPAVISSPNAEKTAEALRLWIDGSEEDGGILQNVVGAATGDNVQQTLVMLKPDNFRFASARPGIIIDIFSASGLQIVGAKIDRMGIGEALEFYGPVRDVLREKLKAPIGLRARKLLESELRFTLPDDIEEGLGELVGPCVGDQQFNELVQFMTGLWAPDCPPERHHEPGAARILALVYSGHNAVKRIRDILGPTDPSKAAPGSVRKEYGQDIMVNAAHASDSPENAQREMGIMKLHKDGLQKVLSAHGI
jgi:nucleoside diphosphate kinase